MNRFYYYLFFLSFTLYSYAQPQANIQKDSLKLFSVDSLLILTEENRYKNPLRAKTYVTAYYKRVKKSGNLQKVFKATYLKAEIYNVLGQKDSAYFFVDKATQLAIAANDEEKYYSSLRLKGDISFIYDDYADAILQYIKVYAYCEKLNDVARLAKIRHNIALVENQIGRRKQAIIKAKENLRLYTNGTLDKEAQVTEYLNTLLSVSNIYTTIADDFTEGRTQYLDSAMTYNMLGMEKSLAASDLEIHSIFLLVQGVIYQKKGAFVEALKNFNAAEKQIHEFGLFYQLSIVYLHKGKNYFLQNDIDNALTYLQKTDSIITRNNTYSPNLQETYTLLAQSYEKKGDDKTAVKYWNIFQKKDKENDLMRRQASENLYKKYEVPSFVNKIEVLQKEAREEELLSKIFMNISIVVIILSIIGFLYYKKREQTFKKRFKIILNDLKTVENAQKKAEEKTTQTYVITDENIQKILEGLDKFEKKELFLQKKCTLNYVAKKINTNSTYLSKTLQSHKQKKFVQYITDLRLEYVLKRLKNDAKFRTYDIKSIASEIGFNTAESFSKAFKKRTGIYPSFYIKNLNKLSADVENS